jgi:hypothetical protein
MENIIDSVILNLQKIKSASSNTLKLFMRIKSMVEKGDYSKLDDYLEDTEFRKSLKMLNLEESYVELKQAYEKRRKNLRIDFDREFIDACHQLNMHQITGSSMDQFRFGGILQVKVNFSKNRVDIKTFARQKSFKSLDPQNIAKELQKEVKRIFQRTFEPAEFLSNLFRAYKNIYTEQNKVVLLKDVHKIIWMDQQSKNFFEKSDAKKMIPYPLDEFSVDLAKLIKSKTHTLENGWTYKISLGAGGINIYSEDGGFNSYKFIEFIKGDNNG